MNGPSETTALALSWALYLLANDSHAQDRAQAEARAGGWAWKRITEDLPALRNAMGHPVRDAVDLDLELTNHGDRSETVKVTFCVENDSQLVFANVDDMFVELVPGARKRIRLQQDAIGITPRGDSCWVDVRTASGKLVSLASRLRPVRVDASLRSESVVRTPALRSLVALR